MPESRGRPRPKTRRGQEPQPPAPAGPKGNPAWFVPVMAGLMILGVLWVAVYYVTGGQWPVAAIGAWNLAVGMGLIMAGFLMTTRWQ